MRSSSRSIARLSDLDTASQPAARAYLVPTSISKASHQLELRWQSLQRSQCCLRRSQGRLAGRCRIIAGDWKDRDDRVTDILEDVASAPGDTGDHQIEEGIEEFNDPFLRKFICKSAETAEIGEQHCRLDVVDVAALDGAHRCAAPPSLRELG